MMIINDMTDLMYQEIANKCVDIYESLNENEFTALDELVREVLGASDNTTYSDLYKILRCFTNEVAKRNIPIVFYKSPGPVNEPIFERFRKIDKDCEICHPTSNVNLEEPLSVEEFIKRAKESKAN